MRSPAILIIEGDATFARVLFDIVEEFDFRAVLATTIEEGLALAASNAPVAIVLDTHQPTSGGRSAVDALRQTPALRAIPMHLVSAADYSACGPDAPPGGDALEDSTRQRIVDAFRRFEARLKKPCRVLVVEDNQVHRDAICRLLASDEVSTVTAGTAAEAIDRLAAETFDVMVLDLGLPDRPGVELLEEWSHKGTTPLPPVIVYTGRSLSRNEEQRLRRFSQSIIIKGTRSPERLLDEVTLFLHQVESDLPPHRRRMSRYARPRDFVFDGRRVLVVEDDVRSIFALTSVLEPKGATVEIARNGREALAHLNAQPDVDLVLMDIMMPEMDGLQATREIRKQPRFAHLPIIALTAKAMADDRENCLAAGANDYMAKPVDINKLLALARVWMPQ